MMLVRANRRRVRQRPTNSYNANTFLGASRCSPIISKNRIHASAQRVDAQLFHWNLEWPLDFAPRWVSRSDGIHRINVNQQAMSENCVLSHRKALRETSRWLDTFLISREATASRAKLLKSGSNWMTFRQSPDPVNRTNRHKAPITSEMPIPA